MERQFASVIITIFLILSRICFTDDKADACMDHTQFAQADSYIYVNGNSIMSSELCTTEMIGSHCDTSVQQSENDYGYQNEDSKYTFGPKSDISTIFNGKFLLASDVLHLQDSYKSEHVAYYIHKSDGKKRVS